MPPNVGYFCICSQCECNAFEAFYNVLLARLATSFRKSAHLKMDLVPSVYNHLVLPPKLPGREEGTTLELSQNVLARLIDGCQRLVSLTPHTLSKTFKGLYNALLACREINGRSFVDKTSALRYFRDIGSCGVLILWVAEQNAAVLVYAVKRHVTYLPCLPHQQLAAA